MGRARKRDDSVRKSETAPQGGRLSAHETILAWSQIAAACERLGAGSGADAVDLVEMERIDRAIHDALGDVSLAAAPFSSSLDAVQRLIARKAPLLAIEGVFTPQAQGLPAGLFQVHKAWFVMSTGMLRVTPGLDCDGQPRRIWPVLPAPLALCLAFARGQLEQARPEHSERGRATGCAA